MAKTVEYAVSFDSRESSSVETVVDMGEPGLECNPPGAVEPAQAPSGFTKGDIRRNMFFCIALDTIWITGWQDFQLALMPLLIYLGAPNKVIGIVLGATWITLPGIFLSPWISRRCPVKKWYLFVVNIPYIGAIGFAGLIVVLARHLAIPNGTLLIIVVASVAAHKLFEGFVALPHLEYVAGCIPASHRGRFTGLSMSIGAVFSMASTALGGLILYKFTKPMSFGYLFLMTWIICQSGYWFALCAREKPVPTEACPKPWSKDMLSTVWRDKPYLRFLIVWTLPQMTWYAAMPFMMAYGLKVLHMPAYTVAIVAEIALIARAIGAAPCGMIVDKIGAKKVMPLWPVVTVGVYVMLALWHSPWAVYIGTAVNMLSGLLINAATAVLAYGLPRPEHRAGYYTVKLIVINVTVSIGAITAGILLDAFSFRAAFIASAIGAALFYPFLRWMIKPISDKMTDYS